VDLAIVEVGAGAWPPSARPWRMSVAEAIGVAEGAREVWLVDEHGHRLDGPSA
jgi:hypothetical protein